MEAQISIINELDSVDCNKILDIPTNTIGGFVEIDLIWFNNFYTLHNIIKEKCYYDCQLNDSFMVLEDLLDLAEEIRYEETERENIDKFLAFINILEENRSYFSNYNFKYYLL